MSGLITILYNNSPIQFEKMNGHLMANATLMGKPYNIEPNDVFKTKSWKSYQSAICQAKEYRNEDLRYAIQGGNNQGTWIHQELIIEFARRLNPLFSIWCNDRIAELLKDGNTQIEKPKTQIEIILASAQILADQEKRVNAIENRINILEAKVITAPSDYFSVAGFWSIKKTKIDTTEANRIGRIAAKICKENGYMVGKIPDARFGSVNTYPSDVLGHIYNNEKNLPKNIE